MAIEHLQHDPELRAKALEIEAELERQWNDPAAAEARRRRAEAERIDKLEGDKRLAQAALDGLRGKLAKEFAIEFWGEHTQSEFTLQLFRLELAKKKRGWDAAERAQKARAPR